MPVRTPNFDVDGPAAVDMRDLDGRARGIGAVGIAPAEQRDDDRVKISATRGETVLLAPPIAGLPVLGRLEDALVDEFA